MNYLSAAKTEVLTLQKESNCLHVTLKNENLLVQVEKLIGQIKNVVLSKYLIAEFDEWQTGAFPGKFLDYCTEEQKTIAADALLDLLVKVIMKLEDKEAKILKETIETLLISLLPNEITVEDAIIYYQTQMQLFEISCISFQSLSQRLHKEAETQRKKNFKRFLSQKKELQNSFAQVLATFEQAKEGIENGTQQTEVLFEDYSNTIKEILDTGKRMEKETDRTVALLNQAKNLLQGL